MRCSSEQATCLNYSHFWILQFTQDVCARDDFRTVRSLAQTINIEASSPSWSRVGGRSFCHPPAVPSLYTLINFLPVVSLANMPPNPELTHAFNSINAVRARYGAKALRWDDKLYADAYEWADHISKLDDMVHDQRPGVCENLGAAYPSVAYKDAVLFATSQWWADQIWNGVSTRGEEYTYFNEPHSIANYQRWGHFGQSAQPAFRCFTWMCR
jgi:hypothetical protein